MNILYINHYAGSIYHGMEFRPYYLSREWMKTGHKVRIVGADFSHLRRVNPDIEADFQIENVDGIEYQWVKAGSYQENGVARAVSMFRFVCKLWVNAKILINEFKPDLVISSSTYPLDAYAARKIAVLAGAKYVHEGHDLWPLTLIEIGGMGKWHPFCLLMGMAERFAYKESDHVVSVLPNSVEHMLKNGLKTRDRFSYIPNGVVLEDWQNAEVMPDAHEKLFSELRAAGVFVVCYVGGHAISNALDTFIESKAFVREKNCAFVLIGKGVEKNRLMKKVKDLGLEGIYFLDAVNKTQVPSVLKAADALYVGLALSSLYRFGVSLNKLYDYMMAGKPVIYGVDAANNEVADANCGITVYPGDAESLANAVNSLIGMNSEERERLGDNGKQWVLEHCEYESLARSFLMCVSRI